MGYQRIHARLLAKIPEEYGFGHYLVNKLDERGMTIKAFCRQTSSSEYTVSERNFYNLVEGKNRTITDLDLIRFALVLQSDPVEMIMMYLADARKYSDLTEEQQHQAALYSYHMNILTLLPIEEVEELNLFMKAKAARYKVQIDEKMRALHPQVRGFALRKKKKVLVE